MIMISIPVSRHRGRTRFSSHHSKISAVIDPFQIIGSIYPSRQYAGKTDQRSDFLSNLLTFAGIPLGAHPLLLNVVRSLQADSSTKQILRASQNTIFRRYAAIKSGFRSIAATVTTLFVVFILWKARETWLTET